MLFIRRPLTGGAARPKGSRRSIPRSFGGKCGLVVECCGPAPPSRSGRSKSIAESKVGVSSLFSKSGLQSKVGDELCLRGFSEVSW